MRLGQQHPTEGAAISYGAEIRPAFGRGASVCFTVTAKRQTLYMKSYKRAALGLSGLAGASVGYRNTSECQELSCRALVGALNPTGTVTPRGIPGVRCHSQGFAAREARRGRTEEQETRKRCSEPSGEGHGHGLT